MGQLLAEEEVWVGWRVAGSRLMRMDGGKSYGVVKIVCISYTVVHLLAIRVKEIVLIRIDRVVMGTAQVVVEEEMSDIWHLLLSKVPWFLISLIVLC